MNSVLNVSVNKDILEHSFVGLFHEVHHLSKERVVGRIQDPVISIL
jgi:hypothetical protein